MLRLVGVEAGGFHHFQSEFNSRVNAGCDPICGIGCGAQTALCVDCLPYWFKTKGERRLILG